MIYNLTNKENCNNNNKMMTGQHDSVNKLTKAQDLITGMRGAILDAENEISNKIEELETNEEDKVSEIFRPDFGRYTSRRIQGPVINTLNQSKFAQTNNQNQHQHHY